MSETSAHYSARDGNVEALRKCPKREINKQDRDGMAPLHWAAWHANLEAVKTLLTRGAETNLKDNEGNSPVHTAASSGNVLCLKNIVEKGGNIWALNDSGQTPSIMAASRRRADCFKYLDSLTVHVQMENKSLAMKMQEKARKDAEKRLKLRKKSGAGDQSQRKTSFSKLMATASQSAEQGSGPSYGQKAKTMTKLPSDTHLFSRTGMAAGAQTAGRMKAGTVAGYRHQQPRRGVSTGSLPMTSQRMTFGNFVLKPGGSAGTGLEDGGETAQYQDDDEEEEAEEVTENDGGNPVVDGDDKQAVENVESDEDVFDGQQQVQRNGRTEVRRSSQSGSMAGGRRSSSVSREKKLPVISLDSVLKVVDPLHVFLIALDLEDMIRVFTAEMMDLDALFLCSDDDFKEIKIPLGPRKKLSASIKDRKDAISNPGKLRCTSL
eukprot:m.8392 g.8392  ORF g.8392 m.8392 type:complete len:435 (+) comp20561_c0_seq1:96-1400(+)